MIRATIYVDGEPYSGIDPDGAGPTPPGAGAFGNGFHNAYSNAGSDVLLFGGEPYVIETGRNLASHMTRILDRVSDGRFQARRIEIRIEA
jgi:hypothetical protein